MSTTFTYALILTACQIVFTLLMYFLGFQGEKMAAGQYAQWLGLIITIVVLWLGLKAVREEAPDKSLSFGKGLGTGVLIALYSGLLSAVYNFVHFKFINPDFFAHQLEFMRSKWAEKGLSEAQMDQAAAIMQKFSGPVSVAIFTPIISVVFGLVLSLILAAILKREPAVRGETPVAA
jgi:ABC-type sugar transport system permease subunit